jgi:NSS family neurotransmitter:Na+ symporter
MKIKKQKRRIVMDKNNNNKRETFSSGVAVFFATLGSAVGLGNIWKFSYLTGENGGGAFVLAYLICVLLLGIPIMIGEFYIGRKTRKNVIGAFEKLKVKKVWKSIGYMGILTAFLIMFFYSAVSGWVYSYVFKALTGTFSQLSTKSTAEAVNFVNIQFDNTTGTLMPPIIWQFIVMLVVSIILIAGVKKGIERATKTLMPVLFGLIIICDIRALTLPEAFTGLRFLFSVDFSKLTMAVIVTALGLAFFKLSIGMGTMITYGSYFTKDNNLLGTSVKVALSDTLVSLMAGIAIFPVVFQFGMQPSGGPGLLFKTIPLAFSKMPFGNVLLIAFFVLTSIAATTAMISIVEVIVAFLNEEKKIDRKIAVLMTTGIIFLVGALTVHSHSLFAQVHIFGKNFFDLFDYISSNILLPLGGLAVAIFIGYVIKKEDLYTELSNNGTIENAKLILIVRFILRYIAPVLLLIVFLSSIGLV